MTVSDRINGSDRLYELSFFVHVIGLAYNVICFYVLESV